MVIWTAPAKQDLRSIFEFIAEDSRHYARRVTNTIVEASEQLELFPHSGRIVPEFGDPSVREIFIYSYRLIYEIDQTDIFVLAVIHGRRNINSLTINDIKTI